MPDKQLQEQELWWHASYNALGRSCLLFLLVGLWPSAGRPQHLCEFFTIIFLLILQAPPMRLWQVFVVIPTIWVNPHWYFIHWQKWHDLICCSAKGFQVSSKSLVLITSDPGTSIILSGPKYSWIDSECTQVLCDQSLQQQWWNLWHLQEKIIEV